MLQSAVIAYVDKKKERPRPARAARSYIINKTSHQASPSALKRGTARAAGHLSKSCLQKSTFKGSCNFKTIKAADERRMDAINAL